MRKKLLASIRRRLQDEIAPQSTVKFLKDIPVEDIINTAISVIYLFTRTTRRSKMKDATMSEVVTAIGHGIRTKAGLKRDSAIASKAGGFVLYSFQVMKILQVKLGPGPNGHATYVIELMDDDVLISLWESLPTDKIEKLPSTKPYAAWTSARHETGLSIVKTGNREVLDELTPETHPIVFDTLNKAQAVGWRVNESVYPLVNWALRNKADAFSDIWEIHSNEARQSKIREATAISSIAKRFIGQVFYH